MGKTIINSTEAPAPIGPYNQAIKVGNTLYMSGQVAINPSNGEMDMENLEVETKRVMSNLGEVLKEAGMDFKNIVKCSIFLANMDDFAIVNAIYGSYFEEGKAPARETVEVACLPKKVNVEISGIAVDV